MNTARSNGAATLLALIASVNVVALQGCATEPVTRPVSAVPTEPAVVPGMPADVRYWGDNPAGAFRDWLELPDDELAACCAGVLDRPHNYLVISSGGVDGAFGAGLLAGWTASGTRPDFQVVTGVSAGAMIAPFAFLGPAYDGVLREIYSAYTSKDLVERRGMSEVLEGGAVMDTAPLRRLIDRYLGDEQVAQIAAEGQKGRKLLIGTTSLNTGRPMVWDLTKIAGSGASNARQLIGRPYPGIGLDSRRVPARAHQRRGRRSAARRTARRRGCHGPAVSWPGGARLEASRRKASSPRSASGLPDPERPRVPAMDGRPITTGAAA